jgi:hypothetical protein
VADGIIFERLGVPAVSIVTNAFTQSSNAMATIQGAPGYRYAMVPHPLSSLTPDECHQRAGEVLPQVLSILGLEETDAPGESSGGGATGPGTTGPRATDAAGGTAASLTASEAAAARAAIEYYYDAGWSDGLPVAPATPEVVEEFCHYVGRDPAEVVVTTTHLDRTCTVGLAAVAAAMAGCQKEHFPVVLAAAHAMQPSVDTALLQSTTGQCQLVIVNGPIRNRLGFNGAGNVFGPGFRANATVGRAIRLIVMNALGIRPRGFDQATQGTPAKYSFCIAENEEESPFEPLHVERGFRSDASVATIHFARSSLHVENRSSNRPEEVLLTIADSMSYAGSWSAGRGYTVVMGPEHAHLLARHGWTKAAAKQFLWEHWGRRRSDLERLGLVRTDAAPRSSGEGSDGEEFVRFGASPDSMLLVVAGARSAGVSTVIPTIAPMFHSEEIRAPSEG